MLQKSLFNQLLNKGWEISEGPHGIIEKGRYEQKSDEKVEMRFPAFGEQFDIDVAIDVEVAHDAGQETRR